MRTDLALQGVQLGLLLLNLGDIRFVDMNLQPLHHPVEAMRQSAHLIIRVHQDLRVQSA
ncbi:hypothetical protein D3C81_1821020 [compost metagenome]